MKRTPASLAPPTEPLHNGEFHAHRITFPVQVRFGTMTDNMVFSFALCRFMILIRGFIGLIQYRIVIHGFIDGYSRYILGLRASNNNRADTVHDLFEGIAAIHGYPSRVRGDHGTENVLVASRMNEVRGMRRGSYIYGR